MKLTLVLLFAGSWASLAATQEQINTNFSVPPGGKLVVDVDYGTVTVATNDATGVTVDVWRKVERKNETEERKFLREYPVHFTHDSTTVTVRAWHSGDDGWSWWRLWGRRYENSAKFTICVPATFNVQLKTAGGGISVSDITGSTTACTSGGGLNFARLHGPLDGNTSGGGVTVRVPANAAFDLDAATSGGGVNSELPVTVTGQIKYGRLKGPVNGGGKTVRLRTSGGSIHVNKL